MSMIVIIVSIFSSGIVIIVASRTAAKALSLQTGVPGGRGAWDGCYVV